MIPETGPYLKAALFCDDVIEGKDGVLSLIRVIDRITITAAGPQAPEAMPTLERRLKLVLMLVSGRARGTHNVKLRIETPDGTIRPSWASTVLLEGEDRGANIVADLKYEFTSEGVYWFHVALDDSPLTKLPFRVLYQRVSPGTPLR